MVLLKSFTNLLTYMIVHTLCVDLVFTSQDNLVTNSGVHSSLHSNCHHQIIFSKFNLNISYPPPYERVVSENNKANYDLITKTIDAFD